MSSPYDLRAIHTRTKASVLTLRDLGRLAAGGCDAMSEKESTMEPDRVAEAKKALEEARVVNLLTDRDAIIDALETKNAELERQVADAEWLKVDPTKVRQVFKEVGVWRCFASGVQYTGDTQWSAIRAAREAAADPK